MRVLYYSFGKIYFFCIFIEWKRIMKKLCIKWTLSINSKFKGHLKWLIRFCGGNLVKMCFSGGNSVFVSYWPAQSFITWSHLLYYFWAGSYFSIGSSPYSHYWTPRFRLCYLFKTLYCLMRRLIWLWFCLNLFVYCLFCKTVRTFFVSDHKLIILPKIYPINS